MRLRVTERLSRAHVGAPRAVPWAPVLVLPAAHRAPRSDAGEIPRRRLRGPGGHGQLARARATVSKFRPMKVALAADPERATHRRYGLPSSVDQGMSLETLQEWFKKEYGAMARARGATIPDTMSWRDIVETANRLNGYEMTPDDRAPERGGVSPGSSSSIPTASSAGRTSKRRPCTEWAVFPAHGSSSRQRDT